MHHSTGTWHQSSIWLPSFLVESRVAGGGESLSPTPDRRMVLLDKERLGLSTLDTTKNNSGIMQLNKAFLKTWASSRLHQVPRFLDADVEWGLFVCGSPEKKTEQDAAPLPRLWIGDERERKEPRRRPVATRPVILFYFFGKSLRGKEWIQQPGPLALLAGYDL